MRHLAVAVMILAACSARESAAGPPAGKDGGKAMAETEATDEDLPVLKLEAAPRYLIGFPMVVALTYENRSKDAEFYHLPPMGLLATRGAIRAQLEPSGGGAPVIARFAPEEEEAQGLAVEAGKSVRGLADLSNAGTPLAPGAYRLTLVLTRGKKQRTSNAVPVELVAPSEADAQEAARLRKMGSPRADTGAWAPFLSNNWATVTVAAGLSAEARQRLALHLFLHRAAYGPDPVAKIDPSALAAVATDPLLKPEAAVLRYELLAARRNPSAAAARAVALQASPGVAGRLAAVDQGDGEIASLRRSVGAERQHLKPPATQPYVP
ncbi:MAG TPA: hypothetical protein VFA20_17145 [Myxococcaceae bacterium]|nr:hypothetical protein [Myxococcaceae bacterium]